MQIANTSSDDAVVGQAASAGAAGHWSQAESLLTQYLQSHPASAKPRFALGWVQLHENKPRESLVTYTEAAKLASPTASDFHHIALDYVLLKDFTDADKWMTRSVTLSDSDGEAWYSMGRIKYTENRFQEAVDAFQRALALMPKSVKAENNLGLAYEGLDRPDDAAIAYRQALEWQQGSTQQSEQPYLNLGKLLTDRNELDQALPLLKRAEAIAPSDGKIHGSLGTLYSRRGEESLAQMEFEEALQTAPNDSALHFQLGQVFRKQGKQDQAKKELQRAAELTRTQSSKPIDPR